MSKNTLSVVYLTAVVALAMSTSGSTLAMLAVQAIVPLAVSV